MSIREIIAGHMDRVRAQKLAEQAGSRYASTPDDPRNLVYRMTGGAAFAASPETRNAGPAARRGPRNHSPRQVIPETPTAPDAERELLASTTPIEPTGSAPSEPAAPPAMPPAAVAQQPAPEFDIDDEKDKHPFVYDSRVTAMREKAMSMGRLDLAAQIERGYADLHKSRFDSMESHYKTELLPKVQALQRMFVEHEGRQMPKRMLAEARKLSDQETKAREAMTFYAYGLVRNPLTKQLGLQRFSDSDIIAPGTRAADVRVDAETGMFELIDDAGQIAKLPNGEPAQWPVKDAEEGFLRHFGGKRGRELMKLRPGEVAFDKNTDEKAFSHPDQRGASSNDGARADDARADVAMASKEIALVFGAKLDPMTRMFDPSTIQDPQGYTQALAEVEQLIRAGTPPMQAQAHIAAKYRQNAVRQAAQGEPGDAGASGSTDYSYLWP